MDADRRCDHRPA